MIRGLVGLLGILLLAMASEVNDQVTNVASADIRGDLGLSHDAGQWFEQIYLSAQIMGMALSPWLAVTFSIRRFALFVAVLTLVASVVIPFGPSEAAIFLARGFQGLAGGLSIPLLMTMALRVLTPDIRLYGLAVYALTATFTPSLGAPLSSLWTDFVGWQFVFLQAIPLCTLAGLLIWYGVPQDEPKYERFRQFDWRGFLLTVIGFGALSTMLYQGDRLDWFNSPMICVLALVSAVALPALLVNEWFHPLPLFKLQLLGRRNFAYGGLALFAFLIISVSASALPFSYLQEVLGFRPEQFQVLSLVIAGSQFIMLPLMAVLLNYEWADVRVVHGIGLVLIIASCFGASFLSSDWWAGQFLVWQALQAIGQPMVVMTLLVMSTNTITNPAEGPFASTLVNAPRALAEVVGVWLIQLITRERGAFHYSRIVDELGQRQGLPYARGAPGAIDEVVRQQALILTLSDGYLILGGLALVLLLVMIGLTQRTLPPRIQLAKH